jgi:DNA polymerase-3 subunit epsilon
MKYDKILFIDTETGGVDPNKDSLLTIGLEVWSKNKVFPEGKLHILIKQDKYIVNGKAMDINGIDLAKHHKKAVSHMKAIEQILDFINDYFGDSCERNGEKITLGGHNINFDVNFLKKFLLNNNIKFHKIFDYRFVDTAGLLKTLYLGGKIDKPIKSLDEAISYFNIEMNDNDRHQADEDINVTIKVFNKILNLIQE